MEKSMQEEKIYKTMNSVGIWNLVLGIVIVVVGSLTGAAMIVNGARLMKRKLDVLF